MDLLEASLGAVAPIPSAALAGDAGRSGDPASARLSGSGGRLRLLVIEDSPDFAALVEQMLRDGVRTGVEVTHSETVSAASSALVGGEAVDCVLLDLSLPDADGLEALAAVRTAAPEMPVVVLTGREDEALAVRAVHEGAQELLVKRTADGDRLARSIRYAVERKRSETEMARQALHDALTGLPNRLLVLDRLNVAIARAARRPTSLAVLFLDLDRFKTVNDSLGHAAGDELLVELANRFPKVLRPGDTVARFGGDEFLILCEDLHGEREGVRVAERARRAAAEPVRLRGRELSVCASVGIASARPGATAEGLIRDADAAMYRAKRAGSGVELFAPEMHAEALVELEIEHELRGALKRGELRVYYQPEVAVRDGTVFGVEALLRWEHPRRGLLKPVRFIAMAEETGLIVPIGEWVLGQGCRQLTAWRREGRVGNDFTVSANLSMRQLAAPGLVDSVAGALASSGAPPRCLCLEVTESCLARDQFGTASVLEDLKALGVRLALDDFGTGNSSLSALSSYPLDAVKIDRAFIEQAEGNGAAARMFEAVLAVVRAAELTAVAEGVERRPQLDLLERIGCDGAQGFLFAHPAAAEELALSASPGTGES